MLSRRFAAAIPLVVSALCAACSPGDDHANVADANQAGPPKDTRVPSLKIDPAEFTNGTPVTAQASFPQATGAIKQFACSDPNQPTRIVQANPGYDVAFVPLKNDGTEDKLHAIPLTGIPHDFSLASGAWINEAFGPGSLPEGVQPERLRVALRFNQLVPSGGGNACTPVPGGGAITYFDYRRTCSGGATARCRYVLDQG